MPIYTYKCSICGHEEEHLESIRLKPESKPCPKCKKTCANDDLGGNGVTNFYPMLRIINKGIVGIVKGSEHPCRG
jgi:putative FmdB family regulatory protein